MTGIVLAALLSTGVDIPDDGVPTWESGMQYTTRTEKRPPSIPDEAAYLKWKWRMNLADPKTGFDNDALREGVRRIVEESGWKELERGQAPNVQIKKAADVGFSWGYRMAQRAKSMPLLGLRKTGLALSASASTLSEGRERR